jgi:serine/threonine protein kinase
MVGQTIKHYKIEKLLGKGGMGVVYQAQDLKLNRPVALKVLKPELTSNQDRVRRFLQEARSAAAIQHPAIAQVYDIDEVEGTTFIAMEFVEGVTVSQLISNQELDLTGSVEIALQAAEGLSKAHRSKMIHRDIKSDNIMVTRDGHAKILDFGLAKLLQADTESAGTHTWPNQTRTQTAHTMTGTVMGTIAYMSPEQARGQDLSYTSDVFSLGIVLYEMVTGELPFKGDSPLDTMHAIAFDEVRPITVIRKNLPPELHRIISRCLRKRPEDRYTDSGELAADLKRLKADIESGIRRPVPTDQRIDEIRHWIKSSLPFGATGIAVAVLMLTLAAVLIFTNIKWATMLWVGVVALLTFRYIKNRKSRMLNRFVSRMRRLEAVRAVLIQESLITVVVDVAQAKLYIHMNSLVDQINKKLFFGKPVAITVRDDFSAEEFQAMLREPGVAYVRDDVTLE